MIHVVAVDPLAHHVPHGQPAGAAGAVRRPAAARRPRPGRALHAAEAGERARRRASRSCSPTSAASRFEAYDSLAEGVRPVRDAHRRTRSWPSSRFVLDWPKLKPEEKRALYSKYACHELHFFLSKKDPAFFDAVVKPYLAQQEGQDVPRPLAARRRRERVPGPVAVRPAEHGRAGAAGPAGRRRAGRRRPGTWTTCSGCCRRTSAASCSCSTPPCRRATWTRRRRAHAG